MLHYATINVIFFCLILFFLLPGYLLFFEVGYVAVGVTRQNKQIERTPTKGLYTYAGYRQKGPRRYKDPSLRG